MDGFLPFVPATKQRTTAAQLKSLFNGIGKNQLTGVIQISYSPDNQLFLIFTLGRFINAYQVTPERRKKIPPDEWRKVLGNAKGETRVLTLPLEGVRVSKMLLECPRCQGTFQLQSRDLVRRIDGWSTSPETILVQIGWPNAEAIMVFPGRDAPVQPVIFTKEGLVTTELDALAAITSWKETQCSVSVFKEYGDADAWIEYHLHLIFTNITEQILTHYNELAGRVLVSVLNQDIDDETLRRGWRISCLGNGIIDHHIFSSPEEAADAYRMLFGLLITHMEAVVGLKVANATVREVLEGMDKGSRDILQAYPLFVDPEVLRSESGGRHE